MSTPRASLIISLTLAFLVAAAGIFAFNNLTSEPEATGNSTQYEVAAEEQGETVSDEPLVEIEEPEEVTALGAKWGIEKNAIVSADLSDVEMNDELAASVAELKSLTKLVIRKSTMSTEGWRKLSELSLVQQLDLRDCPLDNDGFEAIVSGMPNLRAVRLSGQSGETSVDDVGLAALATCKDLKALAADHLWVSSDGLKQLLDCKQLTELYIANTLVDDDTMEMLTQFPKLQKLRLAKISSVGEAGIEHLTALKLIDLDISECSQILDPAMVSVGKIATLERLNLWRDSVSDTGLEQLAGLKQLKWLNLDNTHVSDAGLKFLSQMQKLEFLHLGSTAVSDEGLPALASLQTLKDLKVTRTAVTEEGVALIEKAIPGVDVQLKYIEGE